MSNPPQPPAAPRDLRRLRRAFAAFVFALLILAVLTITVFLPETNSLIDHVENIQRESFTFPTGEILISEMQTGNGFFDDEIHERLLLQANATAAPEPIANVVTDERHFAINQLPASPQIIRDGSHLAVVVGSYIFERWTTKRGPCWYQAAITPENDAIDFLHSFLQPGGPGHNEPTPGEWAYSHRLPYVFDHLDLAQNVLATRLQTPTPPLPEFLIYNAVKFGFPWAFDVARTRAANNLPPPSDTRFGLDISIVTCPGDPTGPRALGRAGILALPGAQEVFQQSLPLKGSAWSGFSFNITLPDGVQDAESFDYTLACVDSLSPHVSIMWKPHSDSFFDWDYVPVGGWTIADQSGFVGNISRYIFIRVHKL